MYTLVRALDAGVKHESGYWLPAIVEDDRGQRLLLCPELIKTSVWAQAQQHGVIGIVRMSTPTAFVPCSVFTEHHVTNRFAVPPSLELDEKHWMPSALLGYVEMNAAYAIRNVGSNPFVHLHTHSEYSPLDGLSTLEEMADVVLADGQQALAVTDHGTCAVHPALQKMATARQLAPVFGMEAYFVDDVSVQENQFDYWHLVLWARDDEGLRNLWALSTASYRDGFYGKPRIDWPMLSGHRTGLLASTACLRGPVAHPLLQGDERRAVSNLMRLGAIFGEDLYVELHANQLPDQLDVNKWLISTCATYDIPTLAVVDSHYARPEQRRDHQIWLRLSSNKGIDQEIGMFGGAQDYHLMGADEVRAQLSYLPEDVVETSIKNTALVAQRCTAQIRPKTTMPIYTRRSPQYPTDEARRTRDAEKMLDICIANWQERVTDRTGRDAEHLPRFRYEADLLIDKQYPGYFLTVWDQVMYAKSHGILVGPGRGSAAGSDVAYLMRITEVDPVKADLLLDRFITKGRKSLPDFDIDYPSSKSDQMLHYVQQRWGVDNVAQVGTHSRLKNKAAFKDVQRVLAPELGPDSYAAVVRINKLIDQAEASTAGLGLSWDELMIQIGDDLVLDQETYPELFRVAQVFRSRLRTYGRHAAGVVIDPDQPLTDTLPMRNGEPGKPMITQFDFEILEWLGYIKWDFLKLRNLDTLQETLDQIALHHPGVTIDVYRWDQEYEDPAIWDELAQGWTMGVFQIETSLGTRTVRKIAPQSVAELADCTTMARPGPMRSGLDKLYQARRAGTEQVHYVDERLVPILSRTFGCMLYQEDVMAITQVLANYDSDEADYVRKILGKKKRELTEAEGRKFVERAVESATERPVAENLWAQMAEFALYSFNRAHAYSYATLAFWTAWFKVHYPREFLTGTLLTLDDDTDTPRFVSEAKRLGYRVLPPDINISQLGFAADGLDIRYGLARVSGIGLIAGRAALIGQPYADFEDFMARRGEKCNIGHVRKLAMAGAFDSLYPHRKALEVRLAEQAAGVADRCIYKNEAVHGPHGLPCAYDWESIPLKLGKTGKVLANQDARKPPLKCTRGCKRFTPQPMPDYSEALTPYTEQEIRDLEQETLGIYLSSSPFDAVPDHPNLLTADDLVVAEPGEHIVLGILTSRRQDPKGRDFGFVTLATRSGTLDAIVFSTVWKRSAAVLVKGAMLLGVVTKDEQDRYRILSVDTWP